MVLRQIGVVVIWLKDQEGLNSWSFLKNCHKNGIRLRGVCLFAVYLEIQRFPLKQLLCSLCSSQTELHFESPVP